MAADTETGQRDSRVLLFSQRNLHRPLFHALQYQLEDLLVSFDDVELMAPGPGHLADLGSTGRRLLNGGLRRVGGTRRTPPGNRPSAGHVTVKGQHDLFFAVFHDAYQLSYLHRLKGWREQSRRAVCLLMEVWTPGVARDADYYRLLSQFDQVYLFTPAAAGALAVLGSPPPTFLPVGVDALQAAPGSQPPERVIDVYAYGRTSRTLHQQLLQAAAEDRLTYVYDTTSSGQVLDHQEHRALLAHLMKRTDFFLAHRINDSEERRRRTGGEESLSTRYFEASAGGAVLLGSEPETPAFRECFDWPDALIPVPYDSLALLETMHDLRRQPDRLAAARAASVRASLLRHDWAYRWQRVLADAGLSPDLRLQRRLARLQALAAAA